MLQGLGLGADKLAEQHRDIGLAEGVSALS